MTSAAVIVAAGSGNRAGGGTPKQYQQIAGRPVLAHALAAFAAHPGLAQIQVVIGEGQEPAYRSAAAGFDLAPPVAGGQTRQASVRNGLEALASFAPQRVLIHDAARPFVSGSVISHVLAGLEQHQGVVPGVPIADTLKRAASGVIVETVDRAGLWAAQTPQGFHFEPILAAHRRAAEAGLGGFTDDAAVAAWAGLDVVIIAGDAGNRKLTTAEDLAAADRELRLEAALDKPDIRVGQGFDVHAFEPGDHVVLCGVRIAHEAGLKGHSDADVAMHALTDAILGGLAAGDIGQHFPPSDARWKDADSAIFLGAARDMVAARRGAIAHCDVTVICEAPRIGPHVPAMRARLAAILGLGPERIAVKATTSEKLGFTGRREGIAALATATLRLPLA